MENSTVTPADQSISSQDLPSHSQTDQVLLNDEENANKQENNESFEEMEDDEAYERKELPTFTNEVVVIRPEYFYENTDCQKDNKFMKESGLQKSNTNELVSFIGINKWKLMKICVGLERIW